jgi:hypothetical protein
MKRTKRGSCRWFVGIAIAASGCAGPPPDEGGPVAAASQGWSRTPEIHSVRLAQEALTFTGVAEPRARVVLRSVGGSAYAAAADDQGRFEIRIAAPDGPLILQPERQVGQHASASPDRLLILDGGRGPVAILRSGGATQRLDTAPVLGAVDSDGRSVIASGRSGTSLEAVAVETGGETVRVRPGPDGAWSALLPIAPDQLLMIGGEEFIWPGQGREGSELLVERLERGWRIGWTSAGNARQWTWLPF